MSTSLEPQTAIPEDDWTLEQAREWVRQRATDGVTCPSCDQHTQVYRRKLAAPVARILIAMHHDRSHPDGWVHIPSLRDLEKGGDTAKARYWGLIEPLEGERPDGSSRVGWWRLTSEGRLFVFGYTSIPKYARVYNGECIGFDATETVTIRDVLGASFSFDELMRPSR